jgi:hypothetical protein
MFVKIGSVPFSREQVVQTHALMKKVAAPAQLPHREPRNWGRWFLAGLGMGAAGMLVGVGQQLGAEGLSRLGEKAHQASLDPQYRAMLKADPSIAEYGDKGKRYFEILHRAAPYMASEPELAATTVKSMMGYEEFPTTMIEKALATESAYQETRAPYLKRRLQVASMPGLGI